MIIKGRERGFFLSVGAFCDLADISPDGKIENLMSAITGQGEGDMIRILAKTASILNKWHEISNGADDYISESDILSLPMPEFLQLQSAVIEVLTAMNKTTVEVEPEKKRVAPK